MAINRYENDTLAPGGRVLQTNSAILRIRAGIKSGRISTVERVLKQPERIDMIAHKMYGDGRLWWMIAAASGIGWWLQAPAGTHIRIPTDPAQIMDLL